MLGTFRKASQSWFAKLLFIPLIVTFAAWGIGDIIRMRASNQPAITIGDTKISPQEVADDFRRNAEQLQRQLGGKLTIDQIRQMGFMEQTIQQIVSRGLLDQEGVKLGLAVDDETLRKAIAAMPVFHNQSDAFDPNLYHQALRANGFTEHRFEEQERGDIQRAQLSDMVVEGVSAPNALVDPIYSYRHEQRLAELIPFAASAMPAPPAPGDDALRAYHKDHAAQFMAPERRGLSFLVVRSADLVGDFKPTDDQIAKAYQDRQGDFTTEETRHLLQVFMPDKDSAQKLADAIKGGQSIADAAKAAGKTVDDLGQVARKSLPLEAVATATFAVEVPGVAGPVQTPLGWNVYYVADQQPSKVKPLTEVRAQIVADLTRDEASNRINALTTKIEDSLGSGAPIEEVANTANVKLVKVMGVDASGHGPDDKPIADLPAGPAFLQTAFKTAKGETSELTELGNESYFLVRVDDVTPPALKPFETVRDSVLAAWTLEQQTAAAQKAAEAAVQRLNNGETASAVAGTIKVVTTAPFTRTGSDTVPSPVAAAAFKLDTGKAGAVTVGDTAYAVHLTSVVPADPKTDTTGVNEVRDQVERSIANDLSQQYVIALDKEIGVRIQRQAIEQQFRQQ